ncbi:UNVERIFIED_CONTAM: TetR/AcrR family transcriptional regulator, partial [Bacteroidetes bacterium 56_B9]
SIDRWFADNIYAPLRTASDPVKGIADMYAAADDYFRSGQRVCLVGVVALGASRDLFSEKVKVYFAGWVDALAAALRRHGDDKSA